MPRLKTLQPCIIGTTAVLLCSTSEHALGGWPDNYLSAETAANIDFIGATGPSFPEIPQVSPPADLFHDSMQRNMGSGAAVGDYDNDGDLDIYLLGYEGFANVLLRNDLDLGTRSFTDVTADAGAGVGDLGLSRVAHFVDLDNDGWLDLLLLNDNDQTSAHAPSRIFQNDGKGGFVDVTDGSGFEPLGFLRCGASLADYDLDGLLDIYVTNWSQGLSGFPFFPGANQLYRNLGGFVFADVTAAVGLDGMATNSFTAIFHDFDGDSRPDLYVAVDSFPDEFWWNTPGGFVQATEEVGTTHVGSDMGVACADLDDDGDLDIYTTNITGPDFTGVDPGNCLYVDQRETTGTTLFVESAAQNEILDTFWGWGVEYTDVENDGDLDIVAVTGFDEYVALLEGTSHPLYDTPITMFINDDEAGFTRTVGIDTDDSRALVAFDYDRDGDEDMLVTNVNEPTRLWENVTPDQGHWLQVAVTQTRGNRGGIGVTVFATIGAVTKRREILAGESYLAGTPAEAHFGLGGATVVDELRIAWTDGTVTMLESVPVDQRLVIGQPEIGDLNGDGSVGFADLSGLLGRWGACPPYPDTCLADLDADGEVGFSDLTILLGHWG